MLDEHGQPKITGFNAHRNIKKTVESLLGLCRGILADNNLADSEILYLDTWLKENSEITGDWPANVIADRVSEVLADGIITQEESDDLKKTLEEIIGGGLFEQGVTSGLSTSFPVDNVDEIAFSGSRFCFTGRFLYGTRSSCEEAVKILGGTAATRVTQDLNYLVIGTLASRDWAHTSHGRKIEKAVQYKNNGRYITILSEEVWAEFLNSAQ